MIYCIENPNYLSIILTTEFCEALDNKEEETTFFNNMEWNWQALGFDSSLTFSCEILEQET